MADPVTLLNTKKLKRDVRKASPDLNDLKRRGDLPEHLEDITKPVELIIPWERGDHVELAQRLVNVLQRAGKILFDDGQLYRYSADKHIFVPVEDTEKSRTVQGFAGQPKNTKRAPPLKVSSGDVSGAIRLAHDRVAETGFFAAAPAGLAFGNSFIEVTKTGVAQYEHSAANRARFAYAFEYVPNALPPLFSGFLAEVFRDDKDASDKIKCLQEYVGISLLGLATRYQRVLVLNGPGSNGKGVLMTVLEAALPPGSGCAIPPQEWADEYRLALLAGKRLNVVSELPEADILEAEAFKSVVSGDSKTGRHIRQAPFTFRPTAGHIFAANRLPGTTDQTHGFWRRFIVIPFNRVFTEQEQDPDLAAKLIDAELGLIVSWFLDGAVRVLQNGRYTVPPSSAEAVDRWKKHADQVRAFADERLETLALDASTKTWTMASDVYRAYRIWASDNGHRTLAANSFGERMGQVGLSSKHTEDGSKYPVRLHRATEG